MAKRKGKSQHRKDWSRLHRTHTDQTEEAESHRRLGQRRVRLPGQAQDAAIFADERALTDERLTGVVVHLYPGGALVRLADRGELLCGLAGTFRPPPNASALAVGDIVTLGLTTEAVDASDQARQSDLNRVDALILQRAPRETALSRPQPSSAKRRDPWNAEVSEKVIAANMQQLVVVASVAQPPLRRRLLDRYLIVAERGELPLRLIINKTDLGTPDRNLLGEYRELGVEWVEVSAIEGDNLQAVRDLLRDRKSVLAGASGVGKSSLLNALVPDLELVTREVRRQDARGRHTTTTATLYELPFGGQVVDTPGIRELGLDLAVAALPWYFPEIAELAPQCKFRNCTHTHEPGCAVRGAVELDRIPHRRYDSYLRILESLED